MDDQGIPEAQRYQIEQIRELEFEELQVHAVEESNSSDDELHAIGAASSGAYTFNTFLAPLHTYLGEVEDTHRRLAFLDGGAILTLPLFYLEGYFLNPQYQYGPHDIGNDDEIMLGLKKVIQRLERDLVNQGKALNQALLFRDKMESFGTALAQKAITFTSPDMWKQIVGAPSMDGLVKKPDLLSFCIASKLPVSESTRQELLEIDGTSYRLQQEVDLLKRFDFVQCKNCKTVIARRSDMLVMSSEGSLGAYVNPHGAVHEIMTFYKVNGLVLEGKAVTEYRWFPVYKWTVAYCANCESHMGWLFTAIKKLKPQSFWAVRGSQVADDIQ